jgi:Putative peptidoglycan binding domain
MGYASCLEGFLIITNPNMKTSAKPLVLSLSLVSAMAALGSGAFADTNNHVLRHHRSPQIYTEAERAAAANRTEGMWDNMNAEDGMVQEPGRPMAKSEDNALFPPEATPGQCWTRVLVPAPVETVQERIQVKEKSMEIIEIPPQMETVQEQVMIKPASEQQEVIPATFKEVQEQVVVKPAFTRQIPVPAEYETVTERVMVKPERSFWKKGSGPLERIDNMTGEIMCYVTEPAEYQEVTRTVLKSPARVREEVVPAEYATVTRTVIDQPAQIRSIPVPAEYQTVEVQKVTLEPRTEKREIPAEYATVERQVTRGESRLEWRRILCETNANPQVISELQTRLNEQGFDAGEVDGVWGQRTAQALARFQDAKGLAQGGVTHETLLALQVPEELELELEQE